MTNIPWFAVRGNGDCSARFILRFGYKIVLEAGGGVSSCRQLLFASLLHRQHEGAFFHFGLDVNGSGAGGGGGQGRGSGCYCCQGLLFWESSHTGASSVRVA